MEIHAELLHLTRKQSDEWDNLWVEDLTVEQRAAFKKYLDLTATSGRVVGNYSFKRCLDFSSLISKRVGDQLKPLRLSDPKLFDEYLELEQQAYPLKP